MTVQQTLEPVSNRQRIDVLVVCWWVFVFVGLLWIVFSFSSVELSFGLRSGVEFRPDFRSGILYRIADCCLVFGSVLICIVWLSVVWVFHGFSVLYGNWRGLRARSRSSEITCRVDSYIVSIRFPSLMSGLSVVW